MHSRLVPSMSLPSSFPSKAYKLSYFEWIFVVICVSTPLQLYNLSFAGLSWSLDRVLLVIAFLMLPFYMQKRRMRIGLPQVLMVLSCLSLPMSAVTGDGMDSYFSDIALSLGQGMILFGIGSFVVKDNPKALKIATFIGLGWFAIFGVFSVYMLYFYYVKGAIAVPYPFIGYISDFDIHKLMMMRSRRLFMPLASAPFLGAAAGFMGMFFFCVYLQTKRFMGFFLGLGFVFICLLTLSRGPMLSFVLAFSVMIGVGLAMRVVHLDRRLFIAGLACLLVFGGLRYYQHFQMEKEGKATSSRMTIDLEKISQGRHLQLRLHAFTMLQRSSAPQLLFGQGFGAFEKDGIGAYSFTGYLTLLVETGLYGATIFTLIYLLPLLSAWLSFVRHRKRIPWMFYVFCMALYLFCCHLFYELKAVRELWIAISIVYGLAVTRSDKLMMAVTWLMVAWSPRARRPIRR